MRLEHVRRGQSVGTGRGAHRHRGPYIGPMILGLLVVAIAAVAATALAGRMTTDNRVYTIAQVRAGLRQHPRAWIGQTVWVQGQAGSVSSYGNDSSLLTPPPGKPTHVSILPLLYNHRQDSRTITDQFVANTQLGPWASAASTLRVVPVVGRFLPSYSLFRLFRARVFRITILDKHCRYLYQPDYTDAVLVDLR